MVSIARDGQLTLGELIDRLEAINPLDLCDVEKAVRFDFEYIRPCGLTSWRGDYAALAIEFANDGEETPLGGFLALLKGAVGKTYEGYKGGDYVMDRDTPLWVANWGHSGNTVVTGVLDTDFDVIVTTAYAEV